MGCFDDTIILTERQIAILGAVVEEYVATAQPVSSSSLVEHREINYSSATVRNEMARLEELGLLLQPHTSAGRIPTDLGYRYYVDHLLTHYKLQPNEPITVPPMREPGVEAACRLLGELTRYTTLALVPGWQEYRLQHIELAPVGDDQLLIMLVTDNRQVMHSLTTVSARPNMPRLRQLNDLLNQELQGKLLSEITEDALRTVVDKLPHTPDEFYRHAPGLVRRGLEGDRTTARIYVEGTTHLFEQQDFTTMPKLRALMEALHEESVFEQLFSRTQPGEVQVSIGAENPHDGLQECAIVFTSYQLSEHSTGRVGVLGPKRMPYRQIIRTVDAVVHHLDQHLGDAKQD